MKKIALLLPVLFLFSCVSKKNASASSGELFEILYQDANSGAEFKFFEIVSTSQEFKMLLKFDALKGKIQASDIEENNFLILNMGEKNTGGYSITVSEVVDKGDSILVTVQENAPKDGDFVTMAFTNPVCIVKIKSKKPIVFQ